MTAIMAYADRFQARPGDTLAFKISRETPGPFTATILKLTGPEAGPDGPPWAPVEIDRLSGTAPYQPTLAGSFAAVAPHPAFAGLTGLTLAAYIWPTTPAKGEQAIAGCWCAESGRGFALGIDARGRLEARIGDGRSVARATIETPLPERRWMLAALSLDPATGILSVHQWPVGEPRFDTERPRSASTSTALRPDATGLPFLMAAWRAGDGGPTSPWPGNSRGGIAGGGFYNGKIDRPRLSARALDAAGIRALMADRLDPDAKAGLVAAWDFSRDISGETVRDIGPSRLDGCIVNLPVRAMTGHNWTGETMAWAERPEQYGAIHFHDDDLVDCCWETVTRWPVPNGLASGVYCARFDADGFPFDVPFVVSPPVGAATNRVAFLASSATYTVYLNNRGRFLSPLTHLYHGRMIVMDDTDELMLRFPEIGISTYDRHSDGSGVCYSSRHRPATNIRPTGRHWNFHCDMFIVHWLEQMADGYDVITDEDLHTYGLELLRPYNVVLTGTHPEYDSTEMLDALDGYLRIGGRFMYMGGNGFYWRIAHHPTRPGVIEVRRPETGVRAWIAEPGEAHLSFTGEHGGLWRRQGRAPNALAGVGFISQGFDHCSYYRRQPDAANPRAGFVFDGVDDEILGDFGILQGGAAGLEIDSADPRLGTPPHALILATSENHSNTYELVPEEVAIPHGASNAVQNRAVHADMVFFETPGGGAVWSSGSIAYAGSLSWNGYDNNIARLTTNVLRRFADPEPFEVPE